MTDSNDNIQLQQQDSSAPKQWPYFQLILVFIVSLLFSLAFTPLHPVGSVVGEAMFLIVGTVFVIRIIIARIRREKNRSYIFYAVLLLTVPALSTVLAVSL